MERSILYSSYNGVMIIKPNIDELLSEADLDDVIVKPAEVRYHLSGRAVVLSDNPVLYKDTIYCRLERVTLDGVKLEEPQTSPHYDTVVYSDLILVPSKGDLLEWNDELLFLSHDQARPATAMEALREGYPINLIEELIKRDLTKGPLDMDKARLAYQVFYRILIDYDYKGKIYPFQYVWEKGLPRYQRKIVADYSIGSLAIEVFNNCRRRKK